MALITNKSGRRIELPNGQILEGARGFGPNAHTITHEGSTDVADEVLRQWVDGKGEKLPPNKAVRALFESGMIVLAGKLKALHVETPEEAEARIKAAAAEAEAKAKADAEAAKHKK